MGHLAKAHRRVSRTRDCRWPRGAGRRKEPRLQLAKVPQLGRQQFGQRQLGQKQVRPSLAAQQRVGVHRRRPAAKRPWPGPFAASHGPQLPRRLSRGQRRPTAHRGPRPLAARGPRHLRRKLQRCMLRGRSAARTLWPPIGVQCRGNEPGPACRRPSSIERCSAPPRRCRTTTDRWQKAPGQLMVAGSRQIAPGSRLLAIAILRRHEQHCRGNRSR